MANANMATNDNGDYLSMDFEGLNVQLIHKAETELNESEENTSKGLMQIKKLIKEEGIPSCSSDDFILLFLRAKKYNIKRSYEQIKQYSMVRYDYMKYYGFMKAENVMPVFYGGVCGILPKRDREGRAIIFFQTNKLTTQLNKNFSADDVLRALQVVLHFVLMFPATQISGFCVIADARIESLEVIQLMLKYLRLVLPTLPACPMRIQKIDIINTNAFIRTLLNIIRPLIPSKILKRTSFHASNSTDLLNKYDANLLPEEFGGTLGPIDQLPKGYFLKVERYIEILQASCRYFNRKDTVYYPKSNLELSGFFK